MRRPVVTIRGIANASVQGIPQHRATADVWNVDPKMIISPGFDLAVKGEVRNSWLDKTGVIFWTDVEDFVHPLAEVKHDCTPHPGRCAAVPH